MSSNLGTLTHSRGLGLDEEFSYAWSLSKQTNDAINSTSSSRWRAGFLQNMLLGAAISGIVAIPGSRVIAETAATVNAEEARKAFSGNDYFSREMFLANYSSGSRNIRPSLHIFRASLRGASCAGMFLGLRELLHGITSRMITLPPDASQSHLAYILDATNSAISGAMTGAASAAGSPGGTAAAAAAGSLGSFGSLGGHTSPRARAAIGAAAAIAFVAITEWWGPLKTYLGGWSVAPTATPMRLVAESTQIERLDWEIKRLRGLHELYSKQASHLRALAKNE